MHAALDEVRGHDIEVEEAAVVRDADVTFLGVEVGKAREPVHVPDVVGADENPPRSDFALEPADARVQRGDIERLPNGVNGRSLDRSQLVREIENACCVR